MKTIVVSGAIANKHQHGGEAWVRLSWARGFRDLGFRVILLEQISPQNCVDADGRPAPPAASANVAYFRNIAADFGFADSCALITDEGQTLVGLRPDALFDLACDSALLVNISGHLRHAPLFTRFPAKAYIDIDPGFTQFWHASGLAGHDAFFTIGENIGNPDCPIPTNGLPWRPTRQPVLLTDWPLTPPPTPHRFTTIASWRGPFGPVEFAGQTYGLKVHEFRKFLALPKFATHHFEVALNIHPADQKDRAALLQNNWHLADPLTAAGDPQRFAHYVQNSSAEFSVAQGVYVNTACGWFSDRSVRYLASGKPVLVQDTGFTRHLPTGHGLLAFTTLEQARAGADDIVHNYPAHAAAARQLAEDYFDSRRVLPQLLGDLGITP